jgi:hypothetical protein
MDGRKDGHNHTSAFILYIARRESVKTVMQNAAIQKSETLRFIS